MKDRALSFAIYGLSIGSGAIAFVYPFLLPSLQGGAAGGRYPSDAPLMLTALVGLCFAALLLEVQGQAVNAKFVALLGILVSMNALLRFLEVVIPGPGGFSPIFFLVVMTGYVYGGRFGFLMGALTLLVSALITGGIGPWLPYQMFAAGWIGMSAPLCRPLVHFGFAILDLRRLPAAGDADQYPIPNIGRSRNARGGLPNPPFSAGFGNPAGAKRDQLIQYPTSKLEIVVLAAFAGLWGLLYGGIVNLSFWPFAVGPAEQYWQPGIAVGQVLRRYAAFYLATSLGWDLVRAVSNVLLTLALGAPTLRALRRFQRRFAFSYQPAPSAPR